MGKKQKKSGKRSRRAQSSNRKGLRLRRDYRKALLAVGILLAIMVRYPLLPFESYDYIVALRPWYEFIASNGNFAALKYDFSHYNVPYLYLLATVACFFSDLHSLLAIKITSIIFDFVLAFFVYRCVRLKYRDEGAIPILAALTVLLAPTVVINSALWGQADAIHTAFLVACLYYLLAGRQAAAFIAFGVAFSFKAQSVFFGPFLLWLSVKKKVNWRCIWLIPAVYLVSISPAWFIGRPLADLLMIYFDQAIYFEQAGEVPLLSRNAPNLYQWIPNAYYDFYLVGIAFTAMVALGIAYFVYKSRVKITADRLVFLATFSVLIMPYLLPKMHDRYFFPADVIAIILAFYCPRYWYVPVVIGSVSVLAYMPFLFNIAILPQWLPAVLLLLIAVLGRQFLLMFRTNTHCADRHGGMAPTTDGGRRNG